MQLAIASLLSSLVKKLDTRLPPPNVWPTNMSKGGKAGAGTSSTVLNPGLGLHRPPG